MTKVLHYGILGMVITTSCHKSESITKPPSGPMIVADQSVPADEQVLTSEEAPVSQRKNSADNFQYISEQFADIRILRYQAPGFESLPSKQKELLYYLYEAALSGREIIWDQNYRYNLVIRRTLEAIYQNGKPTENANSWDEFVVYLKRVWFSNGIHHHYSNGKIKPGFDKKEFQQWLAACPKDKLPTFKGLAKLVTTEIFDPSRSPKKVNLDSKSDLVKSSATNFYAPDLTQKEVERFYKRKTKTKDPTPISWGLNSKLVKTRGKIKEQVWKVGGMYTESIEKIVFWLEKAVTVAENSKQKQALELLISYYKSGDLKTFDRYNIAWVNDLDSSVDVVNGFIEVYGDPLGYRGAFESVVSFRDPEASKRISAIGAEAQWFENNSTIADSHKKKNVTGISAKVITVVVESGDSSPSTPIGINLPNADWIRTQHGSKSVNLGNVVRALDESSKSGGVLAEFSFDGNEVARGKKHAALADMLHTDLHEVIGHASGQINKGIGTPKETLKSYASTLEEGRADLVALYYIVDPKMIELGVAPHLDVGKAAYDDYIRNGLLVQLARLDIGANLEESHMRNRQMVAQWVYEKGKNRNVIEKVVRDEKTYFVIRDYDALRSLFGELLRETQRIKSEGDYAAGKALVETYGVKVDPTIHKEVKERYNALGIAPYAGFINPRLVPVESAGTITDVKIEYPENFAEQMLEYAKHYSYLPATN